MDSKLLQKYSMKTLDDYKSLFGDTKDTEITFYQTFLTQTDYIPNKLVEAKILGIECDDYTIELEAREYCRKQIRQLIGQETQI